MTSAEAKAAGMVRITNPYRVSELSMMQAAVAMVQRDPTIRVEIIPQRGGLCIWRSVWEGISPKWLK